MLEAVRADGEAVEVGRWESEGTVVRGRSPKNFAEAVRRGGKKRAREEEGEWGARGGRREEDEE